MSLNDFGTLEMDLVIEVLLAILVQLLALVGEKGSKISFRGLREWIQTMVFAKSISLMIRN